MEYYNVDKTLQTEKGKYDSEITKDDIDTLGPKGLSMNTDDDSLLKKRERKLDFTGKDLDVPGRGMGHNPPTKNPKDEENTLYGQGAESKNGLEEP